MNNGCFINGIQYKCRTCFDPGQTVYSLTAECSNSKTWRDLLKDIAHLQTNEDELLPKTVCCKCLNKLISYYDFILQIHNVNKKYSELLGRCKDENSTEIDKYTDCFAEDANLNPVELISEIKLEEEQVVPYDIVCSDNNKLQKLENIDTHDPFMETCDEAINSMSVQLEEIQSSLSTTDNDYESLKRPAVQRKECALIGKVNGHITKKHSQETIFPCGFCDQHFNCKDYLQLHLKRKHPGESLDSNSKHIQRLFGDRLYSKPKAWRLVECKLCYTTFTTTKELRQHLEKHSDINTIQSMDLNSNIVQNLFPEIIDLDIVKESISNDIREKQWFKYYTVLNEHFYEMSISDTEAEDLLEETAERVVKYKCELCFEDFFYKHQVFSHLKEVHNEEEIPLKCSRCKLEFISIKMYEEHRQTHCRNRNKVLLCANCPAKFVWAENLKKHSCLTKLPGNWLAISKDQLKRNICELVFEKKAEYQEHLVTHNNDRTASSITHRGITGQNQLFSTPINIFNSNVSEESSSNKGMKSLCPMCGIWLSSNTSLTLHVRTHTGEKPFKCDLCEMAFVRKQNLDTHRRKHTGERPYKCTICGKAFTQNCKLSVHNRIHTGERPYKCKFCQRTFTKSDSLRLHLRNHTGENLSVCDICGKSFVLPVYLKRHRIAMGHHVEKV